ncbi:hypothetical protein L1887_16167 [Cichorium endivia]|nr:hypothetical protein L1887_16167 [Cichorium endivia]
MPLFSPFWEPPRVLRLLFWLPTPTTSPHTSLLCPHRCSHLDSHSKDAVLRRRFKRHYYHQRISGDQSVPQIKTSNMSVQSF